MVGKMAFFRWNAMIGGLSFTVCYLVNLCKDLRMCITFHLPSFTNSPVDDWTKESFKAGEDVLVFYRMTKRCRPDRKYLARTSGWAMKFRKFVLQKQWQIGSRCVWKCLVKIHLGVWVGVGMGMINCRAKKPEVPNMPPQLFNSVLPESSSRVWKLGPQKTHPKTPVLVLKFDTETEGRMVSMIFPWHRLLWIRRMVRIDHVVVSLMVGYQQGWWQIN